MVVEEPVCATLYPISTQSPVAGVQPSIQRFNLVKELGAQQAFTPPIVTYVSKHNMQNLNGQVPVKNTTYTHPTPMNHSNHSDYTQSQCTRPNVTPPHMSPHAASNHHEFPHTLRP